MSAKKTHVCDFDGQELIWSIFEIKTSLMTEIRGGKQLKSLIHI